MINKIEKLTELNDLLKSGAITLEEFEKFKKELLGSSNASDPSFDNNVNDSFEKGKERIILKSYRNNLGEIVEPPSIRELDFKNLSKSEIEVLSNFIRGKQIHAPAEFTEDEINLGNKIFTKAEIDEMNSERSGFNHPWSSILSVFCAGITLFVIMISPCLIFIVGGGSFLCGFFCAITVLNKMDATKLDKTFAYIGLILSIVSVIVFLNWKPLESSNSSDNNQSSLDCSKNTSEYSSGYASGKLVKMMGDSETCEGFVRKTNEGTGRNMYSATDCFCEGFNDGKNGESEKYTDNSSANVNNAIDTAPTYVNDGNVENIDSTARVDDKIDSNNLKWDKWNVFETAFMKAITENNKVDVLNMTVKVDFWGDYNINSEYFLRNDDSLWSEIESSLRSGAQQKKDEKDMMITNDGKFVFKYISGKWYWQGFMGD
jgi:hypothetical protein